MTEPTTPRDTRRTPGRPTDASLRPLIVDTVLEELAETGYARLTLAAVAARAGVSTATIHRRWATKRELILTVAEHLADTEAPDTDTGSLEGDLRELVEAKRRLFSGKVGAAFVALVGEAPHDTDLAAALRQSVVHPTRDHLAAIVGRGTDRGEDATGVDVDAVAGTVLGLIVANVALNSRENGEGDAGDPSGILSTQDEAIIARALQPPTVPEGQG